MRECVFRWSVAEYEKLGDDPAFRRGEIIEGVGVVEGAVAVDELFA